MGLKSAKNFVTANAVETILAVPGTRAPAKNDPPVYRHKEDYGKVPRYLSQVKDEIDRENMLIEEFVRQNQQLVEDADGALAEPMDDRCATTWSSTRSARYAARRRSRRNSRSSRRTSPCSRRAALSSSATSSAASIYKRTTRDAARHNILAHSSSPCLACVSCAPQAGDAAG